MITDKVSIILDDKNIHYGLINRAINIIKDKYNNKFNVGDLTSLNEFTTNEKKYLRKMFSPDITELYIWEHRFYFEENIWNYDESDQNDYRRTIRDILLLLNTGKNSIGETVNTSDYRLIENIYHSWFNSLDYDERWLYKINLNEREFIEFILYDFKSRVGDFCIYNFEFLKTFMEAKKDYHAKKLLDALLGIESCND
jgi:hypothetical protein